MSLCLAARLAAADGFDGHRYVPSAGAAGGFMVERAVTPDHLSIGLGLFVDYAKNAVIEEDRATGEIVSHPLATSLTLDFIASIGLFDRAELAVMLPYAAIYEGDGLIAGGAAAQPGPGLGDLRIVPKVILLRSPRATELTLGLAVPVTLPTGNPGELRGTDGVTVEPRLLVGLRARRWGLYFSGGYRWQSESPPPNLVVGNEITFGAAGVFALVGAKDVLDLDVEVVGGFVTSRDGPDLTRLPLEALGGLVVKPHPDWQIYLGAGVGLTDGVGTPDFRLIGGLRYAPRPTSSYRDTDGDGISDAVDRCPRQAEDFDGFQDEDGCPEADNDHDGIPDDVDECPDLPEERGGNGDGCPDRGHVIMRNGRMFVVGNVLFETGSARIRPSSQRMLDDVADGLNEHKEVRRIRIEGHTDNVGPPGMNQKLSEERAASVRHALVERGVSGDRLTTRGYGETRPVAPNKTNAGRAKNRRVEFVMTR